MEIETVSATPPPDWNELRVAYSGLIEKFGEAWEQGLPEGITDVFCDDAVFLASPFDEPLRGKAAIAEYWKDVPLEQAEVSFRFGEIFAAGPWFSTEYKCTFRRRRTGQKIDVRGALFCETRDGKISEMRMYWHRTAV
jgi:ketosteroid isomerase-like protein